MLAIGKTQEEVDIRTRAQMIELYAEIIVTGQAEMKQEEEVEIQMHVPEAWPMYALDLKVEMMKLEFEREKWLAEKENWAAEMDL